MLPHLPPRRILITNWHLDTRTGTDIVTRDLALALLQAGCEPVVYCQRPGVMSEEIQAGGVRVVTRLEEVGFVPDVIHGHHHVMTMTALLHFPATPGLFVCHNAIDALDHAPFHPNLRMYVAMDFNSRERMVREAHVAEEEVRVVGNAVDLKRFRPRLPLPVKAAKAVLFSNYAKDGDAWMEAVVEGCRAEGIHCDVIGSGVGRSCKRPEAILGDYDIVFGVARCALEASAVGCAVILCGERGFGGMLLPGTIGHRLEWNCGMRLLTRPTTLENVRSELNRYDPVSTQSVARVTREERSLTRAQKIYRGLYEEILHPGPRVLEVGQSWGVRLQKNLRDRQETVVRIHRAEKAATQKQPDMERLTPSRLLGVEARLPDSGPPRTVRDRKSLKLELTLKNGSDVNLSSGGVMPVALSYHWRCSVTGDYVMYENPRTYLDRAIPPGTESHLILVALPPPGPGSYLLDITFVQDHVLWFEDVSPNFPLTIPVTVEPG